MEDRLAQDSLSQQAGYMAQVKEIMKARTGGKTPLAYVRTYGCQQNVADGEKIKGLLAEMGFAFTDGPEDADFILFNTCAVREHAEDRVFGNVGALKNIKRRRPSVIIAVCGCMTEQEHVAERLKKSYPFVNIVFGTHVIHRLPRCSAPTSPSPSGYSSGAARERRSWRASPSAGTGIPGPGSR